MDHKITVTKDLKHEAMSIREMSPLRVFVFLVNSFRRD